MAVTNATIARRTCYFKVKGNDCEIFNFLVTVFLERFEVGTLRSNLPSINTNRAEMKLRVDKKGKALHNTPVLNRGWFNPFLLVFLFL